MKTKSKARSGLNRNILMFYAGIACAVVAAILLIEGLMGDSSFPTVLGIIGVVLIGGSGYRLHEEPKAIRKVGFLGFLGFLGFVNVVYFVFFVFLAFFLVPKSSRR